MKKLLLVGLALATALATAQAAKAAEFAFNITGVSNAGDVNGANGTGITGSVDLFGTLTSPGVYLLNSGTITLNGGAVTRYTYGTGNLISTTAPGVTEVPASSPATFYPAGESSIGLYFDDLYTPGGSPMIDTTGLAFQFGNGNQLGLFFDGASLVVLGYDPITGGAGSFDPNSAALGYDVNVGATPEPSSLLLLGSGLLLLAGFLIKKSRAVTVKQSMNTAA